MSDRTFPKILASEENATTTTTKTTIICLVKENTEWNEA